MAAGFPLAVLISGRGSNMLALAAACREQRIDARIAAVVSDQPSAAGLDRARELGLPVAVVAPADYPDRAAWSEALAAEIDRHGARLVVLAGFMRILDIGFVTRWRDRLLNIHPSLLPRHPGLHTHRRVLEAGDQWHGCTVHFVTEELDAGPAVIQARVEVRSGDDEASLSARVQQWEHKVYPEAVGWFAAGRLACRGAEVWLDGQRLTQPVRRSE